MLIIHFCSTVISVIIKSVCARDPVNLWKCILHRRHVIVKSALLNLIGVI